MSYYVTNENSFLDIKNAHLRVTGNVHTDVLKVGSIGFQPVGSNISGTVNFTNVTTGVTTTSNLNVGGTLNLGTIELSASTHTLDHITARGNVTSTTVQFDNATTGLVTTSNVEVGGELIVSGGVVSNVNLLSVSNVASIKKDSNVVTEFSRSKKLIKYPRVALTQNALNNGYTASASDEEPNYEAWRAFENLNTNSDAWSSDFAENRYDVNNGEATTNTPLFEGERGDWIQIQLPTKIKLEYVVIHPRRVGHQKTPEASPGDGRIFGSTDGTNWTLITSFSNRKYGGDASNEDATTETVVTSTYVYYNYYRLQVTKRAGQYGSDKYVAIGQLEYYGVPEYDPEAHGTDVVVKSEANVPNTDWLEVYYDAKNYTSGVVQDETTNNRDAEMNATFDNSEIKAFSFSGAYTSNVTTSDHGLGTGDVVYTISYWFKRTAQASNYDYLCLLGNGGVAKSSILMWINNDYLYLDHWGASQRWDKQIELNKWYHVTAGHKGGYTPSLENDFIYINGKKIGARISAQTASAFTFAGSKLTLGSSHHTTTEFLNGKIANFRLFNRALSSDEVWQLYAYQKEYFGHGDLSLTLKAGRLGIGTSDPGAVLDVNGVISFTENSFDIYYAPEAEWPASAGYPNWYAGQDIGNQFMWRTLGVSGGENFLYHVPRNGILMVNVSMIHRLLQFRAGGNTTHAVYWCLRKSTDNGATWNPITSRIIGHRWVNSTGWDQEWHPVAIPYTGRVNKGDQVALFVQNEYTTSGSTYYGNFQVYNCRMSGVLI